MEPFKTDSSKWSNSNRYSNARGHFQNRGTARWESTRNNSDARLKEEEVALINQGRNDLFDKKKDLPKLNPLENQSMLKKENLFVTSRWEIPEFIELKNKLNATRNQLNEKDIKIWKEHTRKTNMTGRVVYSIRDKNQIEMCTNAWIKMAEIFCKYRSLIPSRLRKNEKFRTVHICEAPGAFICATNFYLNKEKERQQIKLSEDDWEWTGLSLNPYYEGNDQEAMVDDDRFIVETLDKWYFGVDNSGNILNRNNIYGLWNRIRSNADSNGIHLVTGDGSVDSSGDPNEQESIVSELHYTEAICGMGMLNKGGSLVIKMFNLFECETICLLYILALHFDDVSVFKPASSRAPNAETYIVALNFRGIDPGDLQSLLSFVCARFPTDKALIPLECIPKSFLDSLFHVAQYFTEKQIQALTRNLELEKCWNREIQNAIFQLNQNVVGEFRRRCYINFNYRQTAHIVKDIFLDGSARSLGHSAAIVKGGLKERSGGTLYERQTRKRDREEFLLDNTELESNTNRFDLEQGKSVVFNGKRKGDVPSGTQVNFESVTTSSESIGMKLMKKSGYKPGEGLGIHNQGRSTHIETEIRLNRLGVGHHDQKRVETANSPSTIPSVFDEPLFTDFDHPISCETNRDLGRSLDQWIITRGSNLKSVLSSLFVKFEDLESLYKKREEYIRQQMRKDFVCQHIFISDRLEILFKDLKKKELHGDYNDWTSAIQFASLNKIFKLTQKENETLETLEFIIDSETLSGVAEYLVWQQENQVNGVIVADKVGTLDANKNVSYRSSINCNRSPVHIYCSDASSPSSSTHGSQRYLEQYNKHVFLKSCHNALSLLSEGGHFVCKILDTFTRFTAGLIYLMYCSFDSITLMRPFTLDPSSPTRFLVCQRLKYPVRSTIKQHLSRLLEIPDIENVLETVPLRCLLEPKFQQYLADSSKRLLQREIQAIEKRIVASERLCHQRLNDSFTDDDWNQALDYVSVPRQMKKHIVEPDSGIQLPVGWSKHWSRREERFYYFNQNTKESRWDPPI